MIYSSVVRVTSAEWDEVQEGLKAGEHPNIYPSIFPIFLSPLATWTAVDTGHEELTVEFTTLINMDTKKAIAYYNDNYQRIGK